MKNIYGPTNPFSQQLHKEKYRSEGESFEEAMYRIANTLSDNDEHYERFKDILLNQKFLPGGRIQSAIGSPKKVTPYNCFVSGTIPDSMGGIMRAATEAAETMRLGGGIGYGFSNIRPRGDLIRSLDSKASGPLSFMGIFDALCDTIMSAGHRRGAQMGVLRVDHPDIEMFVEAKANIDRLTKFNISVGVTDAFMDAVENNKPFDLVFQGRVYKTIDARALWDKIMRLTWDWAEPGILFIDRINKKNNLWYCETIEATNPCGEQPLPPYGACLLGSINLVKYVKVNEQGQAYFDFGQFIQDIPVIVRAMDNVVDVAIYPLPQQEQEAKNKRRMGLGVTGLANAVEALGFPYGSSEFLGTTSLIMSTYRDIAYTTSVQLAIEKGAFPLFKADLYLQSEFAKTLPEEIREMIKKHGIRNSHLLSIAPTGTISLCADNVSSGIEPVFQLTYDRTVQTFDGPIVVKMDDYGYKTFGVKGKTADEVSVEEHVDVLNTVSKFVDSSCSKTCNVGNDVSWHRFKDVYWRAYKGGASGCTTFRLAGKRFGILHTTAPSSQQEETSADSVVVEGGACYIDPNTGIRTCDQ